MGRKYPPFYFTNYIRVMTTYRVGDHVNLHGCDYEVKEYYLSAKRASSYPKVLAKILGIDDLNDFVYDTLGYCQHGGKKLGFETIEDANKLINALENYEGVTTTSSYILNDLEVKNYFSNETNLAELADLNKGINDLLKSFNNIKKTSVNVINKVKAKHTDLVEAIDGKNVAAIKSIKSEFTDIAEYITETNQVLSRLHEMGESLNEEVTEFSAEDFINE